MKLFIVRFVEFLNIFLFICTPLYIIDEIEERGKVETGAKNNMEMRRLEKEQVPDLFVATTKKKQFYVFSEASVNRGSLFISADVEKFIIRFSSLGLLPFARSVSINDQVLFIEHKVTNVWSISTYISSYFDFWTVAIFPCSTKRNFVRNCQELRFSRTNVRFFLFSYLSCETCRQKGSTSF